MSPILCYAVNVPVSTKQVKHNVNLTNIPSPNHETCIEKLPYSPSQYRPRVFQNNVHRLCMVGGPVGQHLPSLGLLANHSSPGLRPEKANHRTLELVSLKVLSPVLPPRAAAAMGGELKAMVRLHSKRTSDCDCFHYQEINIYLIKDQESAIKMLSNQIVRINALLISILVK